jgi:hypothetical protein
MHVRVTHLSPCVWRFVIVSRSPRHSFAFFIKTRASFFHLLPIFVRGDFVAVYIAFPFRWLLYKNIKSVHSLFKSSKQRFFQDKNKLKIAILPIQS